MHHSKAHLERRSERGGVELESDGAPSSGGVEQEGAGVLHSTGQQGTVSIDSQADERVQAVEGVQQGLWIRWCVCKLSGGIPVVAS